ADTLWREQVPYLCAFLIFSGRRILIEAHPKKCAELVTRRLTFRPLWVPALRRGYEEVSVRVFFSRSGSGCFLCAVLRLGSGSTSIHHAEPRGRRRAAAVHGHRLLRSSEP